MKKINKIIILGSLILCFCALLLAVGLAAFVPGITQEKTVITALLILLSVLPLILAVVLLKSVRAYTIKAEYSPTRDPLTNLYNQITFWDFLGYEIERSKRQDYRFALILVDIDDFKSMNDLHGHEAGDSCLLEFSTILKSAIRKGDIAARYGGDNFAGILPVCDEAQAYIASKRLLDNLREHSLLLPDRAMSRMTASVGVAVFPDHAKDAQSLFLLADSMLQHAKTSGKDRVSTPSDEVDADLLKNVGEKSILIMDAIKKDQIVPYFQPIVSVNDRSLLAHEVLARIVTPERIIPAEEFIEAAEGMGAIGKIDYLLVEHAFDVVKRRSYRGKLFFNLAPKALVINEFLPTMRKLMITYGLQPSQLVFEITERNTVKNLNLIERTVSELKKEGFQLAIDDFGSGYSSFQYIKMFKVDFLKVDGAFIRAMTSGDTMEQFIVANIAVLAEHLGIKTIAEYVESETILCNVRTAGIDYAQGYHIQSPMSELCIDKN